ncbi:MAG: protein translocase subunit SecD, partial [Nocardioidaceae bacterium]
MASKASRPGRRLIAFAVVIAALYGGVALGGQWSPKLGLDLQGGTSITLEATTPNGQAPAADKLQEARGIIDQRVNGSGVTEATVTTEGNRNIIVEIPGHKRGDLVDTVKQTAQLRFRLVAAAAPGRPQPKPSASPSASTSPSGTASPAAKGTAKPKVKPAQPTATPKGRALSQGLVAADKNKKPAAKPSGTPSVPPTATPQTAPQTPSQPAPVTQPLQWVDNPGSAWLKKFAAYTCPKPGQKVAPTVDDKDK